MNAKPNGLVAYDTKSFLVNGQRVWLHAGDIHYFRHPAETWEDVLRRAKAAGLNTISTYVPWNFHEPEEGQVDFSGDRDLARYLDLIRDLGLYAIFRPGPYICSEWDGGGLPAWLLGKPGIRTRDDDPVYLEAIRRWFARLLPIAVSRQVSRGGPILLVQNENEYDGGWNDSTRSYFRGIYDLFRAAGIDVPVIACNCHGRPPEGMVINGTHERADQMIWPEMVLTYNWGPGAECIRRLREVQPDKPLLMTEYWAGPQAFWGKPLNNFCTTPEYARSMLEFASLGCQVTYYMFDGGTNFGYWAGRNIITSYQSKYPVREGGGLTEKYYGLKPVNHVITQFGPELADSVEVVDGAGVSAQGGEGTRLVVRSCPAGRLLFVSDSGPRPAVSLRLENGEVLEVMLPSIRALVLPLDLEVFPGLRIGRSSFGLLGRSVPLDTVVMWGVAGTEGHLYANGCDAGLSLPAGCPVQREIEGKRIIVVDETLAGRTWFLDDGRIVFGADFAEIDGDGKLRLRHSAATGRVWVADADQLEEVPLGPVKPLAEPPALAGWRRHDCTERVGDEDGWKPLPDGPRSHEALGHPYGYVWYRAQFESDEETLVPLFAPMRSTRLSIYANGLYCGTTGELTRFVEFCGYRHPADALAQDQVVVPLRKGLNQFALLSDHLGRWFNGKPDPQGLHGPVYFGAQRLTFAGATLIPPTPLAEEAFDLLYEREFRMPTPLPGMELTIEVPTKTDVYLVLPSGLRHVAVSVEGRHVMAMPKSKYPFTPVRLPPDVAGRRVTVRLQCLALGEIAPRAEQVNVFLAARDRMLSAWAWTPGGEWAEVEAARPDAASVAVSGQAEEWEGLMPDQKNPLGSGAKPAWYTATFPKPEGRQPVFLEIGRMHKGQIFLNGRNAGRFWQVGGFHQGNGVQSRYYLPRPWMRTENVLAVFEEYGLPPEGVALQWGEAASQEIEWNGIV